MEQVYVRLIEPDGTEGNIVEDWWAINFCKRWVGWTWRLLTEAEKQSLL